MSSILCTHIVLRDGPHALGRLLACCHSRGWMPISIHSFSDGVRCEVVLRLRTPDDRRGTESQVHEQLLRLVDVEHVAINSGEDASDTAPSIVECAYMPPYERGRHCC